LFALRLIRMISRRVMIPAALAMPVSGLLLIWSEGIDLMATHWLVLSVALFVVAVGFAILVQLPTIERMVELATRMSAGAPFSRPDRAPSSPFRRLRWPLWGPGPEWGEPFSVCWWS